MGFTRGKPLRRRTTVHRPDHSPTSTKDKCDAIDRGFWAASRPQQQHPGLQLRLGQRLAPVSRPQRQRSQPRRRPRSRAKMEPGRRREMEDRPPGSRRLRPIVVGDRIFVTCYSGYGVDRCNPGDQKDLQATPRLPSTARPARSPGPRPSTPSSPKTLAGAGVPEHGYASHPRLGWRAGLRLLRQKRCLRLRPEWKGALARQRRQGLRSCRWGSSSRPIIYQQTVIVPAGPESGAIVGLDAATGQEKWRAESESLGNVRGTPVEVPVGPDRTDIVIGAPTRSGRSTPPMENSSGTARRCPPDQFQLERRGGRHGVVCDRRPRRRIDRRQWRIGETCNSDHVVWSGGDSQPLRDAGGLRRPDLLLQRRRGELHRRRHGRQDLPVAAPGGARRGEAAAARRSRTGRFGRRAPMEVLARGPGGEVPAVGAGSAAEATIRRPSWPMARCTTQPVAARPMSSRRVASSSSSRVTASPTTAPRRSSARRRPSATGNCSSARTEHPSTAWKPSRADFARPRFLREHFRPGAASRIRTGGEIVAPAGGVRRSVRLLDLPLHDDHEATRSPPAASRSPRSREAAALRLVPSPRSACPGTGTERASERMQERLA